MRKRQCLIVEDDQDSAFIAEHIFQSLRFETHVARNGKEGLLLCDVIEPDIILLDWNLPQLNGLEFFSKLSTSGKCLETKVIMCTAESDSEKVRDALKKGIHGYIVKPYQREAVLRQLNGIGMLSH